MALFESRHNIGPGKIIQRKDNLLFSEIDGEAVMMSIENSEYYGMDKIGTHIWQVLEKPVSFDQLVNLLMDEYDVARDQCINDTVSFLEILAEKKLILIS